jgi:tetratricopeptide (TPR) repeat protein
MSLLSKIFGKHDGSKYSDAIKLFNDGSYGESANLFRSVLNSAEGNTGSLSAFYLRQCLLKQGISAIKNNDYAIGTVFFKEAAQRWSSFPDLRFWYGYSLALSGDWDACLEESCSALRYNAEYLEARLLSACALIELGQKEEASNALNILIDAGNLKEHPAYKLLQNTAPFTAENIPLNLMNLLTDVVTDSKVDKSVESAIASCRSGSWDDGISMMRDLCAEHPAWPDYKVKLAAALFQVGENSEALQEVEKALLLNPKYRTAAHLKALILADNSRFKEALEVIESEPNFVGPDKGHPGEELFCSYLAAVLCLLTGRFTEVETKLAPWHDLTATFPMASMLIAAANDFENRIDVGLDILQGLVQKWPLDTVYRHALASAQLRLGLLEELEDNLIEWQSLVANQEDQDKEVLLIAGYLSLARAMPLDLSDNIGPESLDVSWTFLYANSALISGNWDKVLLYLRDIISKGNSSERVCSLLTKAYLASDITDDYTIPETVPDTVLRNKICLMHRVGDSSETRSTISKMRELHPDDIRWTWLDPLFWLQPIRKWIG